MPNPAYKKTMLEKELFCKYAYWIRCNIKIPDSVVAEFILDVKKVKSVQSVIGLK